MAAAVARVRGKDGDPAAARRRRARSARPTWSSPARNRGCSPPRSPCHSSTPTALRMGLDRADHAPGSSARRARRAGRRRRPRPAAPRRHRIPHLVRSARAGRTRRAGALRRPRPPPAITSRSSPSPSSTRACMSQHALAADAADVEAAEGIMRRGRRQIPPGQGTSGRSMRPPGHRPAGPPSAPEPPTVWKVTDGWHRCGSQPPTRPEPARRRRSAS